jgi:hypothetical protein
MNLKSTVVLEIRDGNGNGFIRQESSSLDVMHESDRVLLISIALAKALEAQGINFRAVGSQLAIMEV